MYISVLAAILAVTKSPAHALPLQLRNIKSGYPVHCLIALTFTSKSRVWIIRNSAVIAWANQAKQFVDVFKPRAIFNTCFSKDGSSDIICNADMRVGEIRQFCKLDEAGESLIRAAMGQMNLSARGYHRVLKLARTIADLAGSEQTQAAHLAEALQYRSKLMKG